MRAPMLTTPDPGEELFMYLSVSDHAVSAVPLRNRGIQQPVYYISKTFRCRDQLFAFREIGASPGACYQEIASVLSGSYYICVNRIPPTVIIEKI